MAKAERKERISVESVGRTGVCAQRIHTAKAKLDTIITAAKRTPKAEQKDFAGMLEKEFEDMKNGMDKILETVNSIFEGSVEAESVFAIND